MLVSKEVTATSASISLDPHLLPADQYSVSFIREYIGLCRYYEDHQTATSRTHNITVSGLQEASTYSVRVTARGQGRMRGLHVTKITTLPGG